MKICDVTQFYSPLSGGVKRYLHEKINYIQRNSPGDEHVLIVPGAKTEVSAEGRSRIYSIHSPLVSRSSRYRALLNLRAMGEIIERERPEIIESSDPYQVGWKAVSLGRSLRIPVVGFYHSHFPEAYLRGPARLLLGVAQKYVRKLYNRCEATLVPSEPLARVLEDWGVRNVRVVNLGVNTENFSPAVVDGAETRRSLGIEPDRKVLLYVGRLAPEKNTETLFASFAMLAKRRPQDFELLVIGDGPQREQLRQLQTQTGKVKWIQDLHRFARARALLSRRGSVGSPGRSRNLWPGGARESGVWHPGGRNSRFEHGPDHFSRTGIVGAGKHTRGPGRSDRGVLPQGSQGPRGGGGEGGGRALFLGPSF